MKLFSSIFFLENSKKISSKYQHKRNNFLDIESFSIFSSFILIPFTGYIFFSPNTRNKERNKEITIKSPFLHYPIQRQTKALFNYIQEEYFNTR